MATFPRFSKLKPTDRKSVDGIISRFEPYSDFNFTSLFCWNVDGSAEISILNENLVIKIPDYLTGEPVYSIVGNNQVDNSLEELFTVADSLKFVPQSVVDSLKHPSKFRIKEDRDHFDYIYSLEDLTGASGKKYKNIRNKINQFTKIHPVYSLATFNTLSDKKRNEFRKIFLSWARERKHDDSEVMKEGKVIEKFISHASQYNLIGMEISVDGELAGFSINEILPDGNYAVCHIQKALHKHKNIDTVLTHYSSKVLYDRGCLYVNWEQDLGFSGLRQLKESYRPVNYLKKYVVKPISS